MKDEAYSLYRRCFLEDSDAVTDVVFSRRLRFAEKYEKRVDGRLVSVLWLVDKKAFFLGKVLTVPHVVGLCTDPDYRNRGYARDLLQETMRSLSGIPFLTLYPFSHAFYEKLGFGTASYDDEAPKDCEKTNVDDTLLLRLYEDFCRPLDFYFLRTEEDFSFYRAVNAPNGESYALLNNGAYGFSSPDEYIPHTFSALKGEKKGVMARLVDIDAAIKIFGATLPPIKLSDPLIDENNRAFRAENGVVFPVESADDEMTVGELATLLFSQKKGYLADRY